MLVASLFLLYTFFCRIFWKIYSSSHNTRDFSRGIGAQKGNLLHGGYNLRPLSLCAAGIMTAPRARGNCIQLVFLLRHPGCNGLELPQTHFSAGRERQFPESENVFGNFEIGKPWLQVLQERRCVELFSLFCEDAGCDLLLCEGTRNTYDLDFLCHAAGQDHLLDLTRRNVFPCPNDEFLFPSGEADFIVVIEIPDIPGSQPSVFCKDLGCRLGH